MCIKEFIFDKIKGGNCSKTCKICSNDYVNESPVVFLTKCKHLFHTECLKIIINLGPICPHLHC